MNAYTHPVHLLVVDDDEVDRERVQRYLKRAPLQVVTHEAATGEEALRMVRSQPFDCVVLDNQLGDTTGSDLLKRLRREACKDCPVIMVTGAGNEALVVRAMQEGASDYLSKIHLTEDDLVRSVMRSMETHQLRHQLEDMHRQLERRVEEQAATIRQRERDLQDILDHASSLIGYWDASCCVRFGNRAYQTWFGVEPAMLPGKPVREVIGEAMYSIHESRIDNALRGQPQLFEHTFRHAGDSQLRHLQAEYRPDIDDAGRVLGFYVTITDITQIKAAQTRIEALLQFVEAVIDNSPVGMAVYSSEGRCVLANAQMAAVTGLSLERLKDLALSALASDGLVESTLSVQGRATLADGQARHVETAMHILPKQEAQIAWALARVDRGEEPHLLVIAQDITEQKLLNDTLINARNTAQEAARITSAFLANMSHEIRTPMNAIVGLSRLALENQLPAGAHDYIQRVHDSALALMGILDDVLDYSKVEAGQMRLEQADIEVEDMLQRVVDLFSGRMAQKRLHFNIELSMDVPGRILGDPLRLSQILNNLVGNAVKFTDTGHITLTIQTESGLLRFAVCDTGPGIAPDRRDALFAAFAQEDLSITRRYGGTGLGLAICKKLVEMMGGSIGIHSQLGQGSEFWFKVPLVEPAGATSPQRPLDCRVLLLGQAPASLQRLSERMKAMCKVVVPIANDLDAACTCIANGARTNQPVDAVVLDWQHADAQAAAALRTLREQLRQHGGHRVPLICLLPAFERQSFLDALPEEAPDVLLTQPVLPGTLIKALRRARNTRNAQAQGASPAHVLAQRGLPLRGCRVLLVEDNMLNQLVAQAFLQQAGLEVETSSNGEEAVRCMESAPQGHFSAILMDMHMPVLDGLEASRRIMHMPQAQGLPIIAMTAAVLPADRERCTQAGMVDMVTKPILPEVLIDTLLKWVKHPAPARPEHDQPPDSV